jgi:uncharacterized membrane protein (DUF2068 family)
MVEPIQEPAAPPAPVRHHLGLALIAIFKLVKGVLLLATAIGLLRMVHGNISSTVEHWIAALRMDPDNHYFHWLLEKLASINSRQLEWASAGSFFYSALLLTEGFGLWFERRWAEYLTVIATSSFIPIELYELTRKVNDARLVILTINLAIVLYLIRTLRRERRLKE